MNPGFYKQYDETELFYGPTKITSPTYELLAEDHTTYTYPVDGWYWFDTEDEAYTFFGVPNPNEEA